MYQRADVKKKELNFGVYLAKQIVGKHEWQELPYPRGWGTGA